MRIQHNIAAMNSYRNYNTQNSGLSKNLEKLSSGYKINRAGDDAAGLAISEKMRAQITGLDVAQKNAKDGISVVQTAEGALTEVHDMLNRMYSLAEQSANGIYSVTEREKLQAEIDQLTSEINRIADSTNFNGINLLDGSLDVSSSKGSKVDNVALQMATIQGTNKGKSGGAVESQGWVEAKGAEYTDTKTFAFSASTGFAGIASAGTAIVASACHAAAYTIKFVDNQGIERTLSISGTAGSVGSISAADAKAAITTILNQGKTSSGVFSTSDKEALEAFKATFTLNDTGSSTNKLTFVVNKDAAQTAKIQATVFMSNIASDASSGVKAVDNAVAKSLEAFTASNSTNGVKGEFVTKEATPIGYEVKLKANINEFDTFEIGDKIYEFVKAGNTPYNENATVINYSADKGENQRRLVNQLKQDGFDVSFDVENNKILFKQPDQLGEAQEGAEVKSDSANLSIANKQAVAQVVKVNFNAALSSTANGTTLTVRYLDAKGKEQTLNVDYTGDTTGSAANAKVIVTALKNTEIGQELFDVSASGNVITFTSQIPGNTAAQLLSITDNDDDKKYGFQSLTEDTAGLGDAKELSFIDKDSTYTKGFKAGETVTVNGNVYEFTAKKTDKVAEGHKQIVLGTDGNETMQRLATQMTKDGIVNKYDGNGKITLLDSENTYKGGSAGKDGGLVLQIGDSADDFNRLTVSIEDMHAEKLFEFDDVFTKLDIVDDDNVTAQEKSRTVMDTVKNAIDKVSTTRGNLGAIQNRLEHTINNLSVTSENLTDAESSIRDTDVAEEMMKYTKNSILTQAAQAMLAQANQLPQGALQLLG